MYKTMQSGRSMIEMLGVLAIIGVLSVGGLAMVSDAQQKRQETQLVSDVSQLAAITKKMSCQYDDAYSTYTNFLNKSEAIPSHLTYSSSSSGDEIKSVLDTSIMITGNDEYFVVTVSGLNESACMKLATTDWGKRNSNGCLGVSIGTTDYANCMLNKISCSDTKELAKSSSQDYPMSLGDATDGCKDKSSYIVKIWFKACH